MKHSYLTVEDRGDLSVRLTSDGQLMMYVVRSRLIQAYFEQNGWHAGRLDMLTLLAEHVDQQHWSLVTAEQVGGLSNAKLLIAKTPTFVPSGQGADVVGTCAGLWKLPDDQAHFLHDLMTVEVSYFPRAQVQTAEM